MASPSMKLRRAIAVVVSIALVAGCGTVPPYTGQGPHPQLERGHRVPPVDFIGNVLSLPMKLLLWSWKFNLHSISPDTEEKLVEYLDARDLPMLEDTKFRLNEYRPDQDLSRLVKNRYVKWPYRLLLGLPMTLVIDVLLPGRLFPWGDYYNPYTNTVHLFSDHPAVALHEAGHAHDTATRRWKGTYAMVRIIPFVDLYQEYQASKEAIGYLKETADHEGEIKAYKILYPAYGSYVGAYIFAPIGTLVGVLIGHLAGRSEARIKASAYQQQPAAAEPAPSEPDPTPATP